MRGPSPLIEHGCVAAALTGSLVTALTSLRVWLTLSCACFIPALCLFRAALVFWLVSFSPAVFFSSTSVVCFFTSALAFLLLAHQLVGIAVALTPRVAFIASFLTALSRLHLGLEHAGLRTGRQQTQGGTKPMHASSLLSFKTGKSGSI